MPTPFTHLAAARRALADPRLPEYHAAALTDNLGAYLLGSITADGHVAGGLARPQTHFYAYDRPITRAPWRVMLDENPALNAPRSPAQRAFVAGYIGHLAMDELWLGAMMRPHFGERDWATRERRFLMLHIILIHMDERDYPAAAAGDTAAQLLTTRSDSWLPFLPDDAIQRWGDSVARQLPPYGGSETLAVLAPRVGRTPADLRAILDNPAAMDGDLWRHIPRLLLRDVEAQMDDYALESVTEYLDG